MVTIMMMNFDDNIRGTWGDMWTWGTKGTLGDQRDVIVSFGPPEIIVLSLKFHHSRSSAHYHFDIIIIQYFRLLK